MLRDCLHAGESFTALLAAILISRHSADTSTSDLVHQGPYAVRAKEASDRTERSLVPFLNELGNAISDRERMLLEAIRDGICAEIQSHAPMPRLADIIHRLKWLGLFEDRPIAVSKGTCNG